jgi:hypothetical protein
LFKEGTQIINPSGDINLFAYWLGNNYNMVLNDYGKKEKYNVISIPTDSLLNLRKYVRPLLNIHAAEFLNNEYIVVQRHHINSYFPSYNTNKIYIALYHAFSNIFLYLLEGNNYKIWLQPIKMKNAKSDILETTHRVYDMILFWLEKGLNEIDGFARQNEKHIFHIIVTFSGFENYPYEQIDDIPNSEPPFVSEYNLEGKVKLVINASILKGMTIPENNA